MPDSNTALLVMDIQDGIVDRFGDTDLLERLQKAIGAAREHGILVVFVRVAFRRGYPEVGPHNLGFGRITSTGALVDEDTQIHDSVVPQDGEPIVTKKRVGAFTGSDLDGGMGERAGVERGCRLWVGDRPHKPDIRGEG